jgi:hypothetical protein
MMSTTGRIHRRERERLLSLEAAFFFVFFFMKSACASSTHRTQFLVFTFPCGHSPHPLQSLHLRSSLLCSHIPLPPMPSAAQSLQK